MKKKPPRIFIRLFKWFSKDSLQESILGDLEEKFFEEIGSRGSFKAKIRFGWNVIRLFTPEIIKKNNFPIMINNHGFLGNYFKVARRNIWRNKLFSLFQLTGLILSICISLIVFLIVEYEFSYDRHHKDVDQIYRVTSTIKVGDNTRTNAFVSSGMPKILADEFSCFEHVVPIFYYTGSVEIYPKENGKTTFRSNDIIYTNSQFFELFDYEWLQGNMNNSLSNPNSTVISENRARKYFGSIELRQIIGKVISYKDGNRIITGIIKKKAGKSDLTINEWLLFDHKVYHGLVRENLYPTTNRHQLLVKTHYGTTMEQVEEQFSDYYEKYYNDERLKNITHDLQEMSNIHFNEDFLAFRNQPTSKQTMFGLLALAIFMVLVGTLNYVSLSIAQNENRWKEMGVRKTLGGSNSQLAFQSLVESLFVAFIAGLIAYLLAPTVLNIFKDYLPNSSSNLPIWEIRPFLITNLVALSIGLMSGIYPAHIVSGSMPLGLLKKQRFVKGNSELHVRKALHITKFMIAYFFIVAVMIVDQQVKFSIEKDMGFNRRNIINIFKPFNLNESQSLAVLEEIKHLPSVENVVLSGLAPLKRNFFGKIEYSDGDKQVEIYSEIQPADTAYITFYDMKLVVGSNLGPTRNEVLVNETFLKKAGVNEPIDAIGKFVDDKIIVGVLKDYHTLSTRSKVEPLAIAVFQEYNSPPILDYHIKFDDLAVQNYGISTIIVQIEQAWRKVIPDASINVELLNEKVTSLYEKEKDLSKLLTWAVGMTLFISCLGLFGYAMLYVNQRIKEIGIRKVLGAKVIDIVLLLSKESLFLVVTAILFATPFTAYFIFGWLNDYYYSVEVKVWMFILPACLIVLVAMSTICLQVVKAALSNPVNLLRSE